jgi:hypothetical protein
LRRNAGVGATSSARRSRARGCAARRQRGGRGVDEGRLGRAARERLEAERTGAGEQVEHVRAVERAEDREQRLAHPVGGRAGALAPRRNEAAATEGAARHPHAGIGSSASAP